MNWHNLSNQDFDANIKRHVDHTSVPFDPQSWNKMSQKLDGFPPGPNSNSTGSYGLLIVILLLASLFFWNIHSFPKANLVLQTHAIDQDSSIGPNPEDVASYSENKTNNAEPDSQSYNLSKTSKHLEELTPDFGNPKSSVVQKGHRDETPKNSVVQERYKGEFPKSNVAQKRYKNEIPKGSEAQERYKGEVPKSSAAQERYKDEVPKSSVAQESHKDKVPNRSQEDITNSEVRSQVQVNASKASGSIPFISWDEAQESTFAPSEGSVSNSQLASGITTIQTGQSKDFVSPHGPSIESLLPIMLPAQIKDSVLLLVEPPPVIESSRSPWVVGFGYAPEFSMVGSSGVPKPGTNLFLSLEYKLNSRWSLQSGVGYSRKVYQAAGEDYNPPEGFWDYGMVPDATDAACDIIDIPINLRYYINPSNRNRFFASTGISSYLMLTEEYYYHYEEQYGPNLVEEWTVNNENQHFFSIYNLSIGYQKSLGNGWLLEIEPYAKAPLAGVGFAEIELWSTGAWFSVKYNIK